MFLKKKVENEADGELVKTKDNGKEITLKTGDIEYITSIESEKDVEKLWFIKCNDEFFKEIDNNKIIFTKNKEEALELKNHEIDYMMKYVSLTAGKECSKELI